MGFLRQPHMLKGNKRTEIPERVVFFDTETVSVEVSEGLINHQLRLGVGCYYSTHNQPGGSREVWRAFNRVGDFWKWSLEKVLLNTRVYFVAHNLSFDFLVLNGLSELEARGWYAKSLVIHYAVNIWTFAQYKYIPNSPEWLAYEKKTGKKPRVIRSIVFLDLMNYFKMSLEALGEAMGTPKGKIDFATCTEAELGDYCRNDVFIMVEAWKKWCEFIRIHDLGTFGKTLPSQAFNAYRHRFMPHRIYVHSHSQALALERKSYFGGRCECFRLGHFDKGPYYLFDVNSMYPHVMRKNLYPTKMITYIKSGSVADILYHIDNHAIIARVLLKTSTAAYPTRLNKRLMFPTGTFWTTLATPEIRYALDHRAILAVGDLALYEKREIFTDYVDFFWDQRRKFTEDGNLTYAELCKMMHNCLYGKFGQKLDDYITIADDPDHKIEYWRDYDVEHHEWLKFKRVNGQISVAQGFIESFNSFPAIAAHVTAYARLELQAHIVNAGRGNVFYCDTDSLIVGVEGSMGLIDYISDTELGALHLEKKSDTVTIRNVKDYTFAGRRKTKGVTAKAIEVDTNVWGQWQQVSLRSVLWNNYTDNCFWKWVEKHLQQDYKKGLVLPNGHIIPFVLDEAL